ncbi:hypothetical protein CALVIDRAFT_575703, partial [Calocera viscosa TUFC12733]
MPIYKALLKYGHSNFCFDILEYCSSENVILREQYYLDNFDFSYNILKKSNSSLGYKHSKEVLEKMKGRQNAKGFKHSTEMLSFLKNIQLNKKHSSESKDLMRKSWSLRKIKSDIVVMNLNDHSFQNYKSITEAALALNVTRYTLRSYLDSNKTLL